MKCPECRRQYGAFSTAPDRFRPAAELACPHCGAALRVGWCPVIGIGLLVAAGVAASFWGGDWVIHALGVGDRRLLHRLVGIALRVALWVAVFAPGMYALWVIGWYARRPANAGPKDD